MARNCEEARAIHNLFVNPGSIDEASPFVNCNPTKWGKNTKVGQAAEVEVGVDKLRLRLRLIGALCGIDDVNEMAVIEQTS